jgi:hypothetical protein
MKGKLVVLLGCLRHLSPAGEVAPFSLLTGSDAKRWAPMIAQATGGRIMPPWKTASGFGDFAG